VCGARAADRTERDGTGREGMVGFAAELHPPDPVGEPRAARPRHGSTDRPTGAASFDSTRLDQARAFGFGNIGTSRRKCEGEPVTVS
jgi:hypothetical protein